MIDDNIGDMGVLLIYFEIILDLSMSLEAHHIQLYFFTMLYQFQQVAIENCEIL